LKPGPDLFVVCESRRRSPVKKNSFLMVGLHLVSRDPVPLFAVGSDFFNRFVVLQLGGFKGNPKLGNFRSQLSNLGKRFSFFLFLQLRRQRSQLGFQKCGSFKRLRVVQAVCLHLFEFFAENGNPFFPVGCLCDSHPSISFLTSHAVCVLPAIVPAGGQLVELWQ